MRKTLAKVLRRKGTPRAKAKVEKAETRKANSGKRGVSNLWRSKTLLRRLRVNSQNPRSDRCSPSRTPSTSWTHRGGTLETLHPGDAAAARRAGPPRELGREPAHGTAQPHGRGHDGARPGLRRAQGGGARRDAKLSVRARDTSTARRRPELLLQQKRRPI